MKPGMILYREEAMMLLMMDDHDAGEAIRLLARRFLFGDEPETENKKVDDFLKIAMPKLEKDEATYERKVSAGQAGGEQSASKRQAQRKQTSSTTQAEVKQEPSTSQLNKGTKEQGTIEPGTKEQGIVVDAKRFRPPTVQEVAAYCEERGNGISAERFIDHYSANGWKVGKNSMKDWKAAVRNWEKNEFRTQKPEPEMQTHEWNYDELEKLAFKRALGG